eukprot:TRINITY_DN4774_c0_g1_i8.p1 TRINITY_DN4774_c0_g1~~TRINITY_DN4774_c0_g1_i8.p1  ORF type:complete len:1100 (-),score=328.82 TRINITY_DN4774_c0_g1_i8:1365-4664(-)
MSLPQQILSLHEILKDNYDHFVAFAESRLSAEGVHFLQAVENYERACLKEAASVWNCCSSYPLSISSNEMKDIGQKILNPTSDMFQSVKDDLISDMTRTILPVLKSLDSDSDYITQVINLSNFLREPKNKKKVYSAAKKANKEEALNLWMLIDKFEDEILSMAQSLYQHYIIEGAPSQVNLASSVVTNIEDRLDTSVAMDIFDGAKKEILILLTTNLVPSFLDAQQKKKSFETNLSVSSGAKDHSLSTSKSMKSSKKKDSSSYEGSATRQLYALASLSKRKGAAGAKPLNRRSIHDVDWASGTKSGQNASIGIGVGGAGLGLGAAMKDGKKTPKRPNFKTTTSNPSSPSKNLASSASPQISSKIVAPSILDLEHRGSSSSSVTASTSSTTSTTTSSKKDSIGTANSSPTLSSVVTSNSESPTVKKRSHSKSKGTVSSSILPNIPHDEPGTKHSTNVRHPSPVQRMRASSSSEMLLSVEKRLINETAQRKYNSASLPSRRSLIGRTSSSPASSDEKHIIKKVPKERIKLSETVSEPVVDPLPNEAVIPITSKSNPHRKHSHSHHKSDDVNTYSSSSSKKHSDGAIPPITLVGSRSQPMFNNKEDILKFIDNEKMRVNLSFSEVITSVHKIIVEEFKHEGKYNELTLVNIQNRFDEHMDGFRKNLNQSFSLLHHAIEYELKDSKVNNSFDLEVPLKNKHHELVESGIQSPRPDASSGSSKKTHRTVRKKSKERKTILPQLTSSPSSPSTPPHSSSSHSSHSSSYSSSHHSSPPVGTSLTTTSSPSSSSTKKRKKVKAIELSPISVNSPRSKDEPEPTTPIPPLAAGIGSDHPTMISRTRTPLPGLRRSRSSNSVLVKVPSTEQGIPQLQDLKLQVMELLVSKEGTITLDMRGSSTLSKDSSSSVTDAGSSENLEVPEKIKKSVKPTNDHDHPSTNNEPPITPPVTPTPTIKFKTSNKEKGDRSLNRKRKGSTNEGSVKLIVPDDPKEKKKISRKSAGSSHSAKRNILVETGRRSSTSSIARKSTISGSGDYSSSVGSIGRAGGASTSSSSPDLNQSILSNGESPDTPEKKRSIVTSKRKAKFPTSSSAPSVDHVEPEMNES